jgi:hypothetical protein
MYDKERCVEPLFTKSIGSTGNGKSNYTNKVKWNNSLTLFKKINWDKESSGERNSNSPKLMTSLLENNIYK